MSKVRRRFLQLVEIDKIFTLLEISSKLQNQRNCKQRLLDPIIITADLRETQTVVIRTEWSLDSTAHVPLILFAKISKSKLLTHPVILYINLLTNGRYFREIICYLELPRDS